MACASQVRPGPVNAAMPITRRKHARIDRCSVQHLRSSRRRERLGRRRRRVAQRGVGEEYERDAWCGNGHCAGVRRLIALDSLER